MGLYISFVMGRNWTSLRLKGLIPTLLAWVMVGEAVSVEGRTHERGLPAVRYFAPTAYEGHSQVFQTVQDKNGVTYITNYGAVHAYDGERWQRISVPGATFLYGIAALPDETLAICGIGTMGLLKAGKEGHWEYRSLIEELSPADQEGIGEIWDLLNTPEGLFFFARRMMLRWHEGQMKVWHFETEKMIYGFWSGSSVYIQNLDHGLFRLEGETVQLVSDAPLFRSPGPRVILEDGVGGLIVATLGEALWGWNGREVSQWETEADEYLRAQKINRGLRMTDGRLALGTFQGGVAILSADGKFDTLISEESGLPVNGILHLSEDRHGALWCSLNVGVARVETDGVISYYDPRTGLPAVTVNAIHRHEESVYLSSSSGLFRLNKVAPPELPRWSRVPEVAGEMHNFIIHQGELFAAVEGRIVHFDNDTWRTVWDGYGLIRVIYPSRHHPERIYVGGRIGLGLLYLNDGVWKATKAVDALKEDYVQAITESDDGDLWVGTVFSGLIRIPDPGRDIETFESIGIERIGTEHGLPVKDHLNVKNINGRITVSNPEGSFEWNAINKRFEPLPSTDPSLPLPEWEWDVMIEHEDGTRWGSVYPLSAGSDDFSTYFGRSTPARQEDQPSSWEWIPAGLFDSIGGVLFMNLEVDDAGGEVLWVGGWNGLLRWRLDQQPLGVAEHSAEVLIRKVVHEEHDILFAGAGSVQPWQHDHSKRALRFEFAAPVLLTGVEVLYRTKLEGYDENWSEWSPIPDREFTNLPGGNYTFMVEARTDHAHSIQPAVASFLIHPPWYFSRTAFAGYLAVAGLLFWGGVRWRVEAIRRENTRLEAIVAARTGELQESEARLREARDAADHANRAKSRFLANMSHELRTPLNAIMGYAQILERDATIGEENRRRVNVLRSSGGMLLHLINEVLDLSKVEAGKIEIRPTVTDLNKLISDLIESFRPKANQKGVALNFSLTSEIPAQVLVDSHRVGQILFNLIGNALKFTEQGAIKVIISKIQPQRIRIDVVDTGQGIQEEHLQAIFEPFHQGHSATTGESGTGLGLAISRSLAVALGGDLTCTSTVGEGSCFRLELPVGVTEKLARNSESEQLIQGYKGRQRIVMVVDDLELNREVVREMLEPLGFKVISAASGLSALEQAQSYPPDLILLDMRMSPMDGTEIIQRLRATSWGRDIPVLSYSASMMDFTSKDAIAMGCNDCIAKPFLLEDLLNKMSNLLNLEWVMAAKQDERDEADEYTIPIENLERLRALAHRREPAGLKRELEKLRDSDPKSVRTVDRLLSLVATYRLAEFSQELEKLKLRR